MADDQEDDPSSIASAEPPALRPKYKLQSEEAGEPGDGKPKKIDIDTMHAYRDAIRTLTEQRVVSYAAILYRDPRCASATASQGRNERRRHGDARDRRDDRRSVDQRDLRSPTAASSRRRSATHARLTSSGIRSG
jgi:hypothetical protein